MLIVIAALAMGGFGLWMGGSAVVSGRTEYTPRRPGKTAILVRAKHPGGFWLFTLLYTVSGILFTWFAVWLFWASLRESRRIDGGVALYKRLRNDKR